MSEDDRRNDPTSIGRIITPGRRARHSCEMGRPALPTTWAKAGPAIPISKPLGGHRSATQSPVIPPYFASAFRSSAFRSSILKGFIMQALKPATAMLREMRFGFR